MAEGGIHARRLALAAPAAVALLLLSLLTLVAAGPARAQDIDITGEWDFDVSGAIPLSCTATITQSDTAFAMAFRCPDLGSGAFNGTINRETGELSATGSLITIPVDLTGTASPDGASISGSWAADLLGFSGAFSATRAGPPTTPTPLPTLPAPVDVTGAWRVTFSGVFSGACEAVVQQTGSDLAAVTQCDVIGSLHLSGTIDPATGAVSLRSLIDLDGVVSADGNSFSGTWDAFGLLSGTFTAARADDVTLIDVSGSWEMFLAGDVEENCSLSIDQLLRMAAANVACAGLGSADLAGPANPLTGVVSLTGPLGNDELALQAWSSLDESYLQGRWSISDGRSGTLIAVPEGTADSGILAVDCDGSVSGVQGQCAYGTGDTFTVQLHVVAAPTDGYAAIDGGLDWEPGFLSVDLPSLEVLFSDCTPPVVAAVVMPIPPLALACAPLASAEPMFTTGPAMQFEMICDGSGETPLGLLSDTTGFSDELLTHIKPVLINATVSCYAPQHGGPGFVIGDANCDQQVSSVDAAVVLQFEAGLIQNQDCLAYSDVNRDGHTNSVDASLILQHEAGLIADFG